MSISQIFFSFNGRINRGTFWIYGVLGLGIVSFVVSFLVAALAGGGGRSDPSPIAAILYVVLAVFLAWAGLAVTIKRWHDRGKSGWWILIGLIPVIGGLWALIETGFLPGTDGPNAYGPQP